MKNKLKRLFDKLTRKTVIGAFSLAIALWLFTSLNEEYLVRVEIPFEVRIPSSRAPENVLPKEITVETKGSGWNLFNLIIFNNDKKCIVDLSEINIQDSIYRISRSQLITGINSFEEVQPTNIYPEIFELKTGKMVSKKIKINNRISIIPNKSFVLAGNIDLNPDSTIATGNIKHIKNLQYWDTEKKIIRGIKKNVSSRISLKDSNSIEISLNPKVIKYSAEIQHKADIIFHDIPLEIIGGSKPKNIKIYPDNFNIAVSGAINTISQLKKTDIKITANYDDIISNYTGTLIPQITLPVNVKLKYSEPKYLNIIHQKKIKNLEKIY